MFRDCAPVDPAGAREPDLVRGQLIAGELIGARTDRLNESKFLGLRDKVVAPKPGHNQHVGIGDFAVELLARPGLCMFDAGAAQFEPLRQLIRDMREQDADVVFGGEHRCNPSDEGFWTETVPRVRFLVC